MLLLLLLLLAAQPRHSRFPLKAPSAEESGVMTQTRSALPSGLSGCLWPSALVSRMSIFFFSRWRCCCCTGCGYRFARSSVRSVSVSVRLVCFASELLVLRGGEEAEPIQFNQPAQTHTHPKFTLSAGGHATKFPPPTIIAASASFLLLLLPILLALLLLFSRLLFLLLPPPLCFFFFFLLLLIRLLLQSSPVPPSTLTLSSLLSSFASSVALPFARSPQSTSVLESPIR
ncbi:hypothetical protein TWF696_001821 [Orbilia brochopaga]|uniref:Transmembrane protein n=1 Tax=Orbilia brochopaga TaxID=3140254 RepID=A0AAV9U6H2_9PEZI